MPPVVVRYEVNPGNPWKDNAALDLPSPSLGKVFKRADLISRWADGKTRRDKGSAETPTPLERKYIVLREWHWILSFVLELWSRTDSSAPGRLSTPACVAMPSNPRTVHLQLGRGTLLVSCLCTPTQWVSPYLFVLCGIHTGLHVPNQWNPNRYSVFSTTCVPNNNGDGQIAEHYNCYEFFSHMNVHSRWHSEIFNQISQ